MATVVLVGTLDTKRSEYEWLRGRVLSHDVDVLTVDAGVLGEPRTSADIGREDVARAAGVDLDALRRGEDRGKAVEAMARGAASVLTRLHSEERLDAVLGLGGSGGSSLVTTAMHALPIGVPKLMVSTLACGDTRPYVAGLDIAMMGRVP